MVAAPPSSRETGILAAFGLNRLTSGVAYGGEFASANGESIDTLDPSTGEVLARVQAASASLTPSASRRSSWLA
jgi:hypothetical protein